MRATHRILRLASACVTVALFGCTSQAQPTLTATLSSTSTPPPPIQSSPTPSATVVAPSSTPSPTINTQIIETFAPDINPLTGEKVDDPAVLQRRPLAIKVANSTEATVRPQSGVSYADIVVEHETEGGVTRWTAIYLSQSPSLVGSHRSCRIIDADLPAMFKSLLACSGFSGGTREYYIKPTEFFAEHRVFSEEFGDSAAIFVRSNNSVAPHNLFVNPAALWEEATRREINNAQDLNGMIFSVEPIQSGARAAYASISYGAEFVEWQYDPDSMTCSSVAGCYMRSSNGVPHTDALNGIQLSAANVVIIYANHVEDGRYLEDVAAGGHYSIQIQIWNDPGNPDQPGGRAQIIRDGQIIEGQWSRPGRFDMFSFTDASGNPIALKPGITWFQMVRPDALIQTESSN